MRKFAAVLVLLMLSLPVFAGDPTAGNFLKIGVGGRPVAMGEAYTALANGALAACWNPAGLAGQESFEIISMHADWFMDTSFQYLGFAFPEGDLGTLGLSYRTLNYGNIAAYNVSGTREADIAAYDSALTLSWARAINERLAYGLNLKYVAENLASANAQTMSLDFGSKLMISDNLTLGASLQNIIGGLKFVSAENPLPRRAVLGIKHSNFILEPLILAADYDLLDLRRSLNLGIEYDFNHIFAVRAGMTQSRLQGGIGFQAPFFDLDYAYVPYEDLGTTHRLSISLRFGIRKKMAIERHYKLGKDYYKEQKYLAALAEFKKVLEFDPLNKDSREFVDRIVKEMRQKTLLERVKSMREEKQKARELMELAILEFQKNHLEKAQKFVNMSLKYAPNNKKALDLKKRLDKVLKLKR